MATIKISDLAPVTNVADSEMSYIELTDHEQKSIVGGILNVPSGGGGGGGIPYVPITPFGADLGSQLLSNVKVINSPHYKVIDIPYYRKK